MSIDIDGPYRATRRNSGIYHTDPDCPAGRKTKRPVEYTGNEHGYRLCQYCAGDFKGPITDSPEEGDD